MDELLTNFLLAAILVTLWLGFVRMEQGFNDIEKKVRKLKDAYTSKEDSNRLS